MNRITITLVAGALATASPVAAHAQGSTTKPVAHHETQAQLQKQAKITLAAATAAARKEEPGARLTGHELEREKGKLIYSFEFKVPGKTGVDEVNIDAMTGALVDKSHESPADEAKEAAPPKKPPAA